VEAALSVVADVLRALHLCGRDDFERNSIFCCKRYRIVELNSGQAGGVGDYGKHLIFQFSVGGPGEIGGIDSAGVGDQESSEVAYFPEEGSLLFGELGGIHGIHGSRDRGREAYLRR